jgi:flavin reductase (DIM6/NTAB) family NADH-FMN oxidoreductase RutF
MREMDLGKAFTFLESGPVILVTTFDGKKNNIMTISWHMIMDFSPHIAISTGPWNTSFEVMMRTKECVIAVPGVNLIEAAIGIGTVNGDIVDKFDKFSLTSLAAKTVKAPLIKECLKCIECKVIDYVEKHGLVILSGERAWINERAVEQRTFHAVGDGTFIVDGEMMEYRAMMGNRLPPGV